MRLKSKMNVKTLIFICNLDSYHCVRWIRYFKELDYKIIVVNLSNSQGQITGVDVRNLKFTPSKHINSFIASIYVKFLLKFENNAAVHVHYLGVPLIAAIFVPANRLILTAWGSDVFLSSKSQARISFLRWMLRRAHVITGDSEQIIESVVALGANKDRVYRINFGIETDMFVPSPSKNTKANKVFSIISLRNLELIYDVSTLLDAVKFIVRDGLEVRCVVYGSGKQAQKLLDFCQKEKLEPYVHFMGRYNADELPHIFTEFNLYVSTSTADAGIASSTAEAMSCEVPVLISDAAENSKWIKHGFNGWLFETSNGYDLAQKIIRVMEMDNSAQKKIGKTGRETIVKYNDIRNEMFRMKEIIDAEIFE